jgi:hypothetical protein
MQILRRPLFVSLHYWRTILLVSSVGLIVAQAFHDEVAVLLCTLACAFVFTGYERRRWITVSPHFQMGDILLRLSLALSLTYWLAQHGAQA